VIAFIFGLLFLLATIAALLVRRAGSKEGSTLLKEFPDARPWLAGLGAAGIVIAVILLLVATVVSVSTKNIGVETAFGKTSGELSNGLHLVPPWVNVTEMDAAIQTDNHTGKGCLNVRIANQQTACVDISIRWRIIPSQADQLFQNYHNFETVRDSLVTRELTAAINNQLRNYNPLNSVVSVTSSSGAGATGTNPTLTQVASNVTGQMQREIGGSIDVINTIIPIVTFDSQTQQRINQLQQQVALTRIAEQEFATNTAQAKANQALAASVSNSPNVLVAQCLTILNQMVKNGQAVPAGFSCWPGSGLSGVIANASTPTTTPGK
jgi:regulator of protease activity HflC (stomatin/prohibitin superfamily)